MLFVLFRVGWRLSSLRWCFGSTLLAWIALLGVRWWLLVKGCKTVARADLSKEVKKRTRRLIMKEDASHDVQGVVEQNASSCRELRVSGISSVSKAD
jgi:hypothetical protein